MNDFLRNQFVNLTAAQLARIDAYYPKAEQFPGKGQYWRSTANAYGDMRYICPGIFISSMLDKYGVQGNWNYHWDVLSEANNANGNGVTHTAESSSIWGLAKAPESALMPAIQSYWTSFIRTKNPNTFKLANVTRWERWSQANMQRIYFPNDPAGVKMETVPSDQKDRCSYLSSIGASIRQ
jgi:carboxylesterase type B